MTLLAACAHTMNALNAELKLKHDAKEYFFFLPFIGRLIRGFLLSVGTLKREKERKNHDLI